MYRGQVSVPEPVLLVLVGLLTAWQAEADPLCSVPFRLVYTLMPRLGPPGEHCIRPYDANKTIADLGLAN